VINYTYGCPDPGRGSPGSRDAAEPDRKVSIGNQPLYETMGRITSNVEDEIVTRIDTLAAAEGLSRSEWAARAVIDRLAVEERGAGVPQEETVPRHEYDHAIQIRDLEITHLKKDLTWFEGQLANRSRQQDLLLNSNIEMFRKLPPLLPPGRGAEPQTTGLVPRFKQWLLGKPISTPANASPSPGAAGTGTPQDPTGEAGDQNIKGFRMKQDSSKNSNITEVMKRLNLIEPQLYCTKNLDQDELTNVITKLKEGLTSGVNA